MSSLVAETALTSSRPVALLLVVLGRGGRWRTFGSRIILCLFFVLLVKILITSQRLAGSIGVVPEETGLSSALPPAAEQSNIPSKEDTASEMRASSRADDCPSNNLLAAPGSNVEECLSTELGLG